MDTIIKRQRHTPEQAVSPDLAARYQKLNDEFLRRARIAWTQAS